MLNFLFVTSHAKAFTLGRALDFQIKLFFFIGFPNKTYKNIKK